NSHLFFFQPEDGIRDRNVTGVQTCALPIPMSKTDAVFDIVPGVPPGTAVPAYAGAALGGTHTEIDARTEVNWAAVAAAPQPLILHANSNDLAEASAELMGHGIEGTTPVAVTNNGTINTQRTQDTTLASV